MTERSGRDELLFQFFAGYFHQDWDADGAASWQEVASDFVAVSSVEEVRALREALVSWLAETVRGEHPGLFTAFGCYYDPTPDGLTERAWVERIVRELSRDRRT